MGCLTRSIGVLLLLIFTAITGVVMMGMFFFIAVPAGPVPTSGSIHISLFPLVLLTLILLGALILYNVWKQKQNKGAMHKDQETRILHDIYDGLGRFEDRVDNLEAILQSDKASRDQSSGRFRQE